MKAPSVVKSDFDFLAGPSTDAARRLLGCELVRTVDGRTVRMRIVETEAYDQTDAASHSFKGQTPRTDVMFGPPGRLYVYFTYGMHYCCNVVTGPEGTGAAVLLRAAEVLEGDDIASARRRGIRGVGVANGPAKLCQALQIDKAMNGHDLQMEPLHLVLHPQVDTLQVVQTTRIGISQAQDVLWRFYIKDDPHVSKK